MITETAKFQKASTVIPVADIYDTIEWYQKALGFSVDYVHGEGRKGDSENYANFTVLRRDDVSVSFIMDEGGPVWSRAGTGYLNLAVSNVEAIYAEVETAGVTIERELKRENWPAKGFSIKDPSGNEVHIEEELPG